MSNVDELHLFFTLNGIILKGVGMKFEEFVRNFKKDIDYSKTGMIVFHNGVVRGTSRNGKTVEKISVKKNSNAINEIVKKVSALKGITKADAVAFEGVFEPGDDLLFVGVAGDVRENVFHVLTDFVNELKKIAFEKREITVG